MFYRRRGSQAVRQRSAKPPTPVQLRSTPPVLLSYAWQLIFGLPCVYLEITDIKIFIRAEILP